MAVARFYKGRPVKRMYQAPGNGIKLIMVNTQPGVPGDKLTISQEDWDTHGELREVPKNTTAALRKLA